MKQADFGASIFVQVEENRENYREFFEFDLEIADFCPQYANFVY